jgi:5'-3' exonuclease
MVKVYLLFDNPTSTIKARQEIDENYKSHRLNKKYAKEIYKTIEILIRILKCYSNNFYILNKKDCEADDLTFPLLQHLNISNNGFDSALCISNDLDWSRNISENVHWYNFYNVFDISLFEKEYGFKPVKNKVKMYKAIRGDKSDGIPIGLPYVKEDVVLQLIDKFNTMDDLVKNVYDSDFDTKVKNKITENAKRLITNYQLVDFLPIDGSIEENIIKCEQRIGELKIWYKVLKIELESWMQSTEELKKNFLKQKEYKRVRGR